MNVTVLGCGVFGMAIANSLLNNNTNVFVWNKFQNEIDDIKDKFPTIKFTTDIKSSIKDTDMIVVAIPVNFIESTLLELKPYYKNEDVLIVSKGIDTKNNKFAYEIVESVLGIKNIGVIFGGSFAVDMMDKKVLGLTLGTNSDTIKDKVSKCLESNYIKIQYSNDIVGVSVCGSIKNVMAIGVGILDGAKYPESTRFLFLTKAIYEINTLIKELNGNKDTIMSYAGIDDIMMTCTSSKSRNYTLGKLIGEDRKEEINNYKKTTTIEGLGTSKSIYNLLLSKNINLPIISIIYDILYDNKDYNSLIQYLESSN